MTIVDAKANLSAMDAQVKRTSIDDLPIEILAQIFAIYVKSEGHGKLCSLLSTIAMSWRKALLTPSLWKEVNFAADDFCGGYAWMEDQDILERFALVRTLDFTYNPSFIQSEHVSLQALRLILMNSPNLKHFCFRSNQNIRLPNFLLNLPALCSEIRKIKLERVDFPPQTNVICHWIDAYNVNMTSLILRDISLGACSLIALSKKVAESCPNMSHLVLDSYSSDGQFALNDVQAGCPKIRKLSIKNSAFTENDDLSSCFCQLEEFCYKPFPLTFYDSNVDHDVMRVLRGATNLKKLELIDVNFRAETMLQLPCKLLKELRFECYVEQPVRLYETLCQWKYTLTAIDAICNEDSQQALFQYIEEHGKDNLECLSLRSYSIPVEELKDIVRHCVKLRFLKFCEIQNLFDERISLSTREEIRAWLD